MSSTTSAASGRKSGLLAEATLPAAIDAPCRYVHLPQAGRIAYYTNDMGNGRPLVLLHSVNAAPSAREMRPLFEHYRNERPVYAPDLPGFGRSERRDRDYSPALYAEFIRHFLRDVVATPADIIAFSLSAELGARAIVGSPELCRSLVMISPTGFSQRQPSSGPPTDRILKVLRLPILGGSLFNMLTSRLSIRHFIGLSFAGKPPADLVDYAYATAHQPGARYAPFTFLSMKLFTPDADRELFEPLRMPVLVLYDQDPNVSFERLGAFESKDNWHIRRISPTRGLPHWERMEQTVEALDTFWDSID